MSFVLTKAEKDLLLKLREGSIAESALIQKNGSTPDARIRRAVEGCLAKGFVAKTGGLLILTESGKKQR